MDEDSLWPIIFTLVNQSLFYLKVFLLYPEASAATETKKHISCSNPRFILQPFFSISIILEGKFCPKQSFSSLILPLTRDPLLLWTTIEVKLQMKIFHFTHIIDSMRRSIIRIYRKCGRGVTKTIQTLLSIAVGTDVHMYIHILYTHFI